MRIQRRFLRKEPRVTPLKRPLHRMPPDVELALADRDLMGAYRGRPAYQRNDYIGWIERAKREETRAKRLGQMLAELEGGTLYMNMRWHPTERDSAEPPPEESAT
jgi:hypothetical protein